MLIHAAEWVKPGGRIVYSTCSIEAEENQMLIEAFFAKDCGSEFELLKSEINLPWEAEHDGGAAFLLRKMP